MFHSTFYPPQSFATDKLFGKADKFCDF